MDDIKHTRLSERLSELDVHFLESRPGVALVENLSNGHIYEVTLTSCECEDFRQRNGGTYVFGGQRRCKHQIAMLLSAPCPGCGGTMKWTPSNDTLECSKCHHAQDAELVQEEGEAEEHEIPAPIFRRNAAMTARDRMDVFGELRVNASVAYIEQALDTLTPVEFKRWVEMCETFENLHPSHFEGSEEYFIKHGTWEAPVAHADRESEENRLTEPVFDQSEAA